MAERLGFSTICAQNARFTTKETTKTALTSPIIVPVSIFGEVEK